MTQLTNENIAATMASDAATFVANIHSAVKITLDYSAESIGNLEKLLAAFVDPANGPMTDERAADNCVLPGAYLGETIRRLHGGTWAMVFSKENHAEIPAIQLPNSITVFPLWKVFKRLVNGPSEDLNTYYAQLVCGPHNPRYHQKG